MRALLLCVLIACQGGGGGTPAKGSASVSAKGSASVSANGSASEAAKGSASDPWEVVPRADDPPSLVERHRLAEQTCPTVKAPFFFRVEKDGQTSWLLGTRHIGVPFSKFPAVVHDTLHGARLVVFEVAPDDHLPRLHVEKVSLPDALGPDLWKKYRALVGSAQADGNKQTIAMLAGLQIALMYTDPSAMLEKDIQKDLEGRNIPQQGLETSSFQQDLLIKLFDVRLLRVMVAAIKDRDELKNDEIKALTQYCTGVKEEEPFDDRTRAALHEVGYTDADIAGFEDQLIYSRNAAWIPKLEDLFAKGGVFVAVGAGHLRGPKGVPALLTGRGYKVTRVTPP